MMCGVMIEHWNHVDCDAVEIGVRNKDGWNAKFGSVFVMERDSKRKEIVKKM